MLQQAKLKSNPFLQFFVISILLQKFVILKPVVTIVIEDQP